ncbi:MAG TPA: site-specific integrase [Streptosporangiaceae bacterium]
MLVQRVLMPVGGRESWTLLGDDGEVVEPAERYLACLAAIERSPNTVRAYAISLKLWFEFLQRTAASWDEAGVEDVARFVGWLRAPAGNVIVLAGGSGARGPATAVSGRLRTMAAITRAAGAKQAAAMNARWYPPV